MNPIRIAIYYDAGFFRKGSVYFRYNKDKKRGWFDFTRLHAFFENYVADKAKAPREQTKVVAAHYYDGRMSAAASDDKQLNDDREMELQLIKAGVTPHYLPLKEKERGDSTDDDRKFKLSQKGVDVQLAIDVLDEAHTDRYDVAILFTGDEDFVPLVRRVTSLGKQILLSYFTIDAWQDDSGKSIKPTYASSALIDAVTWTLDWNHLVNDRDAKDDVQSVFYKPKAMRQS